MLQFTKRQLFLGASALIGALLLSHQTGLYTPLGSKRAESATGFGLDNDLYSDVDIDSPIEVVVPNCSGIRFTPLPYTNAVFSFWYDLKFPLALSATYDASGINLSGGRYGREHIYEVQLIALFIDWIRKETPQIWNPYNNATVDFCGWANHFLNQPYGKSTSLISRILQCLPNTMYPNGFFMPWLEQTTNGIKANAWGGKMLRTEQRFKSYSADKMVSVMRATAGVKSYMSVPLAYNSWIQQSTCIKNQWANWLTVYSVIQDISVPPPARGVNIVNHYLQWEYNITKEYTMGLEKGMNNMIGWWNDVANGLTNPVNVRLNYPNKLNQTPNQTAVTGQALVNMWYSAVSEAAQSDGPFAELFNSTLETQ